jgi:hypothetical protein
MAVVATLWVDRDFRGLSRTSTSGGFRYYWNKWGAHNDTFSSMRAWGSGNRGTAYAFENINFDGTFAALNVADGGSSRWSYFGDAFNDKVSSSLIVARNPQSNEIEVPLRQNVLPQFTSVFDAETAGTKLHRSGGPRLYGTFFPSYDTAKVLLTIDQNLTVEIDNWPDYDANVKYDVAFFLSGGHLHGYAAWSHVWVESGILSGTVHDRIAPRLHAAKTTLTSSVESQLRLFSSFTFTDVYLLPGPAPNMSQFGFFARYDDDVILVLVRP